MNGTATENRCIRINIEEILMLHDLNTELDFLIHEGAIGLSKYEKLINELLLRYDGPTLNEKLPYRCPVCNGTKIVHSHFYSSSVNTDPEASTAQITCRTCDGTGIVWGK